MQLFARTSLFTTLCCLMFFSVQLVLAKTNVKTIALFNGKAMLSVNGKPAKIIEVGQVLHGVKLVEATTDNAVVEIAGKHKILSLNSGAMVNDLLGAKQPAGSQNSVQLWSDSRGFFRIDGEINGRNTEFLIDTGANLVVLSSREADLMAIKYADGTRGLSTTASGTAPIYVIQADTISIGGIEVRNVKMAVVVGNFPVIALLGMTFLDKMDMTRSGNRMGLTKRF
ncbi:MAG: aspartyl protease family protein [Arenicella sp.]|jgi:aspartyl protease family protein